MLPSRIGIGSQALPLLLAAMSLTVLTLAVTVAQGSSQAQPVSLNLRDRDLSDFLRLFHDISGLDFVMFPGTDRKVTVQVVEVPWDQVLERMLAAEGLASVKQGSVIAIAAPERLRQLPRRQFKGPRVDVDFQAIDLRAAFTSLASKGGLSATVDAAVVGHATLALRRVPWDQALDLLAWLHSLELRWESEVVRVSKATARP